MRFSPALFCVAIISLGWLPAAALGQDNEYETARMEARRELQLAKIEFRNYWQIDYPRIRRDLDAQIAITEAEIRNYRERVRLYDSFDRFSTGSAVELTLQSLRICLLDAELRVRDLWAERNNLIRFRTHEWRILEMRVHDARLRVAEIEAAAEDSAMDEELPDG
jgi:hypothetical protein